MYDFLASAGAKYGVGFWKPGSGIIHQVSVVVAAVSVVVFLEFYFRQIKGFTYTGVTEVHLLENSALKTRSRTICANFCNIAQTFFCQ